MELLDGVFCVQEKHESGGPGADCLGPNVTPKYCAEAPSLNVCEAMRTLGGNSWGWGLIPRERRHWGEAIVRTQTSVPRPCWRQPGVCHMSRRTEVTFRRLSLLL